MTDLKQTLINIAKAIVDHPDDVNVLESEENNKVTLVLNVAESDMGMVIGKGGKIAKYEVLAARALEEVSSYVGKLKD